MSGAVLPADPIAEDAARVVSAVGPLWEELRGARLFVTGGTGYFGFWLLRTLQEAEARLGLGLRVIVLSRDPEAFLARHPGFAEASAPWLSWVRGDVRDFPLPEGEFTDVIHFATDASGKANEADPGLMLETIAEGTQRALALAARGGCRRFLIASSGRVYGPQPAALPLMPEDHPGGPDPTHPLSAYGEGKRLSELMAVLAARRHGFASKIARCYAQVGPHLPGDGSFAAGNFLADALAGRPLAILGDGTPLRSYLYASDLMTWLWTIHLKGKDGRPYNVGSEVPISIREVADAVAVRFTPPPAITVARTPEPGRPPDRYLPSTLRAREELGLRQEVPFGEALDRTLAWHRAKR